jgi:hypothetical protein
MEIGGFVAIRYAEFAVPVGSMDLRSRIVFLLDGRTQYQLNCQSTAAERVTINRACDQMLSTLRRR